MQQRLNLTPRTAARTSRTGRRTRRRGGHARHAEAGGPAGVRARPRPPAGHAAMAAAVVWLLVSGMPGTASGGPVTCLVIVAPLIAATAADARRTTLVAAAALALTIAAGAWPGWTGLATRGLRRERAGRRAGGDAPPGRGAPGADDRDRAGRPARAAAAAAPAARRDQHRGPLPPGHTRRLGRRGPV